MTLKTLALLGLLLVSGICKAQDYTVNLSVTGHNAFVSSIYFKESGIRVFLDRGGRIIPFDGDDEGQFNSSEISLDQSNSDIEYYTPADGAELAGKVKRIGGIPITYYDRFDWDELVGRVKSIGNVKITYYDRFNWDELKGKIKSVGDLSLSYYDRFDWDELRGKLKKIGNTTITYYDRFDADYKKGWVKNIAGETAGLHMLTPTSSFN